MNKQILRLALIGSLALSAAATTGTQTQTQTTTPGIVAGSPNTGGISFNFNQNLVFLPFTPGSAGVPADATLVAIKYTIDTSSYFSYSATSPLPGTFTFFLGTIAEHAFMTFDTPTAASPTAIDVSTAITVPLTTSATFTSAVNTISGSAVTEPGGNWSFYTSGTPTFNVTTSGQAGFSVTGGGTATVDALGQASVKLEYLWQNDVPEASTYAAGAVLLAGVGFVARRRMAKA